MFLKVYFESYNYFRDIYPVFILRYMFRWMFTLLPNSLIYIIINNGLNLNFIDIPFFIRQNLIIETQISKKSNEK